jgi:AraC family transcriptional regulator
MSHLNAICRSLDFVEAHLTQDIMVADMAAAASYSLYHFSRTFNRIVHHTPYDYLMRRRLSESATQLLESDKKIIDIALDFQFNNPETYSRAFKRMFGMQPSHWRVREGADERLLLPRLTPAYLRHINQGDYLRPLLEQTKVLRLVGVMTLVRGDTEVIPELWKTLACELERVGAATSAGAAYGITWYPEGRATRGALYLAAVEAPSLDVAVSALIDKNMAPQKCVRFVHRGSRRELDHSRNYIYHTWLPRSGERPAYSMEIECHGVDWDGCISSETDAEWELYIPVV